MNIKGVPWEIQLGVVLAVGVMLGLMIACSEREARRYEARKEIFKDCMELAAKSARQAVDDVSDIVSQCGEHSYYISNGQP